MVIHLMDYWNFYSNGYSLLVWNLVIFASTVDIQENWRNKVAYIFKKYPEFFARIKVCPGSL